MAEHGHGHDGHPDGPPAEAKTPFQHASRLVKGIVAFAFLILMLQFMELFAAEEGTEEEAFEQLHHYGIFLLLLLLVFGLLIGWFLDIKEINWLPEAGACLIVGVIAGLVLEKNRAHETKNGYKEHEHVFQFDTEFFFLFLLPPIILESGFNMSKMQRRKLFQNIGAVCALALAGALMSTMVIVGMMYAAGGIAHAVPTWATDAETGMTVLESMIFGSLVSATDPVTILAVFGKMGADRDLYVIVFGESVLNDAVAIVLYKTFSTFNPHNCERYD